MLLLAIVLLIRPLLQTPKKESINQEALNLDLYKQHMQELDNDLANGQIEQQEYLTAQQDLEKQLIMDIPETSNEIREDKQRSPLSLAAVLVIIPVLAVVLYIYLGNPDTLDGVQTKQTNAADAHAKAGKPTKDLPSVSEMIVKLEQKVKEEPDSIQGWKLLSRSYMHTRQFKKAEIALRKLTELETNDPNSWANYADIVAVNQKGRLEGKPFEYTKRALSLQPKHPKALWLAGTYHFQQDNYKTAIRFWEILKAQLPPESTDTKMIMNSINDAKKRMGIKVETPTTIPATSSQASTTPVSISGNVKLSKNLADKTSPTDTVFVYARAAKGPRMPLAIIKKQVKDLPFEFTLNDAMAMMPQMKLSNFERVIVTARISKSGNAITQTGDLLAQGTQVKINENKKIVLEINSIAP